MSSLSFFQDAVNKSPGVILSKIACLFHGEFSLKFTYKYIRFLSMMLQFSLWKYTKKLLYGLIFFLLFLRDVYQSAN